MAGVFPSRAAESLLIWAGERHAKAASGVIGAGAEETVDWVFTPSKARLLTESGPKGQVEGEVLGEDVGHGDHGRDGAICGPDGLFFRDHPALQQSHELGQFSGFVITGDGALRGEFSSK
jgi:hypothetical protein